MNTYMLYSTEGQIDKKNQTILFNIPFQPNLINKIEDQGELKNIENVRKIQFKYFDQESILLYFQYEELVKFIDLKVDQFQELERLLYKTISCIFNLNKKQYKLMKIQQQHILATRDGSIYLYHFEQNDSYDYTFERQIIEILINFYLDNNICQNDDNFEKLLIFEEYRDQLSRSTSMNQMLNLNQFKWLFQQKESQKSLNKTFYQDMLKFYKRKESQKINIREQFIYRFGQQLSIQLQQKLDIETILFKIYVIDAFKDKISKTLIGFDHVKLNEIVKNIKIRLMESIYNNPYSPKCLLATINYLIRQLKIKTKDEIQDKTIVYQDQQDSFIKFYLRQLKESFIETKNLIYLFLIPYLVIIKHFKDNFVMCPIIDQMKINGDQIISLPYQQITFEEISQLITSNNEQVIRRFIKGGCFQKIPNQETFIQ